MTLNMLRASRIYPSLSTYNELYGAFDFNKTPLAPLGIKIIIHEKPAQRASWDLHGVDGRYLGPAMEHYRCYRVYVTKTRAERIADTVEFPPADIPMPETSSTDRAIKAIEELTHCIKNPAPATPFNNYGDETEEALQQLAEIFTKHKKQPRVEHTPIEHDISPRVISNNSAMKHNKVNIIPIDEQHEQELNSKSKAPINNTIHQVPEKMHDIHIIPNDSDYTYNTRSRTKLTRGYANAVQKLVDQEYNKSANLHTHYINHVYHPTTGKICTYSQLSGGKVPGENQATWTNAFANELGRLAQGVGTRVKQGTNTIVFIPKNKVPIGRKMTYGRSVTDIRPHKEETHRVRLTVGGDMLEYPHDVSTETTDLTTAKCLINSILSTEDSKGLCADVKDFYLNTTMEIYEYMKLRLETIPSEIVQQYGLNDLAADGWVYIEIRKGMYGLKQAGKLANEQLKEHLAGFGYAPTPMTPGLWRHATNGVIFSLCVDDFLIKYRCKEDADHLLKTLQSKYTISTDWDAAAYCGVTLQWNYGTRTCDLSMPKYVQDALKVFLHPHPTKAQHAPHPWLKAMYGAKSQHVPPPDDSALVSATELTFIQQVIGKFLYYARAVDCTMLTALNELATTQTTKTATTKIMNKIIWFLDYAATHPDAKVRYHASGMVLHIQSDASYLSVKNAKSTVGGHCYLGDIRDSNKPPTNGPLFIVCNILKNVVASAAEAELAALFHNAQEAVILRTTLEEIGHKQPATPIKTDNSTAAGIINNTIKQKKSRSMEMKFFWVKDKVKENQFVIFWKPGNENTGDYFTKHHPASHHRRVRPIYVKTPHSPSSLQGCPKLLAHRTKSK